MKHIYWYIMWNIPPQISQWCFRSICFLIYSWNSKILEGKFCWYHRKIAKNISWWIFINNRVMLLNIWVIFSDLIYISGNVFVILQKIGSKHFLINFLKYFMFYYPIMFHYYYRNISWFIAYVPKYLGKRLGNLGKVTRYISAYFFIIFQ